MNNFSLINTLKQACAKNDILDSTLANITPWLEEPNLPALALQSLTYLIENQKWEELDNRFYKGISFGTGGMRGPTITKCITPQEAGLFLKKPCPDYPAIGSNCLNDFNIVRATIGFFRYTASVLKARGCEQKPKLVIAHDVRYFSRHFCLLTASTWAKLGGEAFIFDGPRSTPQLSFSVRFLKAHAGVVITASHNPSTDNGYKVYFEDGAQVVAPHAEGIMSEVNAVNFSQIMPFLSIDTTSPIFLGENVDKAYEECVLNNVIAKDVFKNNNICVVFTPIHGTGQVISTRALDRLHIKTILVEEQMSMDGGFPTVKSPNPETPEALSLAIKKAEESHADLVVATDPDADRMGVAVPQENGKMVLLTGNIIGALLAEYRISEYKKEGVIPKDGSPHVALIKTFVTTPLQEQIAKKHGLKCINTLTGFKWIGAKLKKYEAQLMQKISNAFPAYDTIPLETRSQLLAKHSTFFVFGGEESYGYLGIDALRDKDANGAIVMFCELLAALKRQGKTVLEYLDQLYCQYGYYEEDLLNIYYEGADGAKKIKKILDSYQNNPPTLIDGITIVKITDFSKEDITDADGDLLPKELFYLIELANGYRYAIRGSGTEPKIKFYLFACERVPDASSLKNIKEHTRKSLKALRCYLEQDARARAN